ncbi:MAG TPA: hypothetical protein VLB76_11670 [Thermoanaerobaculia bacterium]|jgi:hypothetical protein|nr:hypothetical protein [Thermoanaerobaculia bacterium]
MTLADREKKQSTLMGLIITSITSIVVAAITTYGVIEAGSSKLDRAQKSANSAASEAQDLTSRAEALSRSLSAPVGSIFTSTFTPAEFAQAAGDPTIFDPAKSKWALADGSQVVGSRYHVLSNGKSLSDLRGLFLRGMNHGRTDKWRDPEDNREAGKPQPDQFQTHGHKQAKYAERARYKGGDDLYGYPALDFGPVEPTALSPDAEVRHGSETRPANVAVFYYIRIN